METTSSSNHLVVSNEAIPSEFSDLRTTGGLRTVGGQKIVDRCVSDTLGVTSSQPPETSTRPLMMSTGGRDARLVFDGVKAGNANGPRVFLLSTVKTPRSSGGCTAYGNSSASNGVTRSSGSRVSLLKTDCITTLENTECLGRS